jgi:hypothetical protein
MHAIDDIADPATFGEDLAFNARETRRLAPGLCPGCADTHIAYTVMRPYAPGERIEGDRPQIVAIMRTLLADAVGRSGEPIDVVLAGSADTGLLATCAHAAAAMGDQVAARIRYTVLDLCPTPLVLCVEFARRHGLSLSTRVVDLTDGSLSFPADIVVVHSVFRFLPVAGRPAALAMLGRWLKPHGSVVFSNSLFADDEKVSHVRSAASSERLNRAARPGRERWTSWDRWTRRRRSSGRPVSMPCRSTKSSGFR